jgi:hypothetical protein
MQDASGEHVFGITGLAMATPGVMKMQVNN